MFEKKNTENFMIRNLNFLKSFFGFCFWNGNPFCLKKGIVARSSSYALKYNSWSQLGPNKRTEYKKKV